MNKHVELSIKLTSSPFVFFYMVKELLPAWSVSTEGMLLGPSREPNALQDQLLASDLSIGRAFLDRMVEYGYAK